MENKLNTLNLITLRKIAKSIGLSGYSKLRKSELINRIVEECSIEQIKEELNKVSLNNNDISSKSFQLQKKEYQLQKKSFWQNKRFNFITIVIAVISIIISIQQYYFPRVKSSNSNKTNSTLFVGNDRLIRLLTNISDKIDEELKNPQNQQRKLSEYLEGRIIALSNGFSPDNLNKLQNNKLLSLERGQLLLTLIGSKISKENYDKIFSESNFQYSLIPEETILNDTYLKYINLKHSQLNNISCSGCNLDKIKLDYSSINNSILDGVTINLANLDSVELRHSRIRGSKIIETDLSNVDFRYSNCQHTNFTKSDLRGIKINAETNFSHIGLDSVKVESINWLDSLQKIGVKGIEQLKENYHISPTVERDIYQIPFYRILKK